MNKLTPFTLAALLLTPLASLHAAEPALHTFPGIHSDAVGKQLQSSMIWAGPEALGEGVAVTFRKTFTLTKAPAAATLSVFADARYILWVNGKYVERGPCRFQPNGPEYDVLEIAPHLQAGTNVLALLVAGNLSGGKVMRHDPGLTALLACDGRDVLHTNPSWKCTAKNPYQKVGASWADLVDERVDARVVDGDWTAVDHDDRQWQSAKGSDGSAWGPLTARRIPRLRETPVPVQIQAGATLPVTLTNGQSLRFNTGRIVQAYPVISFTAEAGAELAVNPYGVTYIAKAGPQTYFTLDTKGTTEVEIVVKQGKATITDFQLVERLYPFTRLGAFTCNDPFLNQLWEMCARSCEVLSEDSYVDCADRERVEWMDDTPPGFDITQTAMAGPAGANGKPVFSDPRLLEGLVRRTGLTLQPEGWVKAHTCSDRYDIHAKMEDRACDWVEGLRLYYEATGDTKVIKEIWPAVVAQMDYFLKRRGDQGLVSVRDWVVWGNPIGYLTGQTTTLNAFVQKALADSAILGGAIGEKADSARFAKEADDLAKLINSVLWDEKSGSYFSGYFSDQEVAANATAQRMGPVGDLPRTNHRTPPTLHANIFALDRGIVPPDRRERVLAAMLKQTPEQLSGSIMVYYYVMKQMYALDRPELDTRVLGMFRQGWKAMTAYPWQCSWEELGGGSLAHIYGMYPGYFLSTDVLGVRRDAPVWKHQLVIEPHLGDLTQADGVVVTEFGPVPVSWSQPTNSRLLTYSFTIPDGVHAMVHLPKTSETNTLILSGVTLVDHGVRTGNVGVTGRWFTLDLPAGTHAGTLTMIPLPPDILTQPTGASGFTGESCSFSVSAFGPPLTYQWLRNSKPIPNAIHPVLTLDNLALTDAGKYQVVISNPAGKTTSTVATLQVVKPVIRTIYQDHFSGPPGALDDRTPDSTDSSGKKWIAASDWKTDGTQANVTNSSVSAFLPFTPEPGNLYRLSADINCVGGSNADWISLGFANGTNTGSAWHTRNSPVGWLLARDAGSASEGQTFSGPGTSGVNGTGLHPTGVMNYTVILDTRPANPGAWTFAFLVNSNVVQAATAFGGSGPAISSVGMGMSAAGGSGYVKHFTLTSARELPPNK